MKNFIKIDKCPRCSNEHDFFLEIKKMYVRNLQIGKENEFWEDTLLTMCPEKGEPIEIKVRIKNKIGEKIDSINLIKKTGDEGEIQK